MKNVLFSFIHILLWLFVYSHGIAQSDDKEDKMEWFENAKLGIFIHWGIYAVNGIDESWSFFNNYISYEDYMEQTKGFTAENYNPEEWVQLIKQSGAQYAILTSKHHDGVALWDTKLSDLNVLKQTPAKRDLISPFVSELRKEEIKVGLYYSILDWSHPDYDVFTKTQKRYELSENPEKWNRFTQFNHGQIEEVLKNFNPDLWWFDGDWEHSSEEWKASEIRKLITQYNPKAIINSRLTNHGDYGTPEQGLPVFRPKDKYWELCMTMNDSWGFQHNDTNYKTSNQIIRILIDCISMGGNLLIDIGPKADGTIPEEQVNILKGLGRWMEKHKGEVYQMKEGIPAGYFNGPTALSGDETMLYLFLDYNPNEEILIKGLKNKVNRVYVVGNGTKLNHRVLSKPYWSNKAGLLYIDVPDEVLDPDVTIIAILLDGKIDLETKE